jgi:hypothetical protein
MAIHRMHAQFRYGSARKEGSWQRPRERNHSCEKVIACNVKIEMTIHAYACVIQMRDCEKREI